MEKRIGVVGIVIDDRHRAAQINSIISDFGDLIIGRMGVPYRDKHLSVMALIVEGTTDEIGAFTGKLGNIRGVQVKTALSKKN